MQSKIPPALARFLQLYLPRLRNRHFFVLDILVLSLMPALALVLRLERPHAIFDEGQALFTYTLLAMVVRLAVFYRFGLYRRYWPDATADELLRVTVAVLASTFLIVATYLLSLPIFIEKYPLPRAVPILDGILTLLFVGASRFSARVSHGLQPAAPPLDMRRVLIIGAGFSGQSLVRELRATPHCGLLPVAFLDDDLRKQKLHISNIPVLGSCDDLAAAVNSHQIDQVIIAMPTAPGKRIRECLRACEKSGVPAMTVPGIASIIGGQVSVNQLRKVEIEDLLRREPIQTDIAAVSKLLSGRRVLITGGGGSIGSELCRQVLHCHPSDIAVLGHGENSIFAICNELENVCRQARKRGSSASTTIHPILADVRHAEHIQHIVRNFQPDVIFHAAAHKHVPLMEANPGEALSNNIFGTKNLLDAAEANNVAHFVLISTDKAVNPTSIMGASKRVAEMLVLQAAKRSRNNYVAVRFGNVLGSRGSVVPIFKQQIAAGGPVTVTHPEMTRYFMTIPESVQLVLQSTVLGQGGAVLMLDMGEPVRILDLARDLISLSGLEVGRDVDIEFSGIRPGEKLFEELLIEGENFAPTAHTKIRIARDASGRVPTELNRVLSDMFEAINTIDRARVIASLQNLVPQFQPDEMRPSPETTGLAVVAHAATGEEREAHLAPLNPSRSVRTALANERIPVNG